MAPKLYMTKISPPVRAVLMCAANVGVNLDLIETDLFQGDHLKPEFLKLNPSHTIPVLDDNGFILHDSHAIMGYLVDQYAKDKSLYPTDVKKRALINQKLYFNSAILFARSLRTLYPIFLDLATEPSEENVNALTEAYGFLEAFLENSKFIAGDELSIADFSIVATLINCTTAVPADPDKFPKLAAYRERMESVPHYEINKDGGGLARAILLSKLKK